MNPWTLKVRVEVAFPHGVVMSSGRVTFNLQAARTGTHLQSLLHSHFMINVFPPSPRPGKGNGVEGEGKDMMNHK